MNKRKDKVIYSMWLNKDEEIALKSKIELLKQNPTLSTIDLEILGILNQELIKKGELEKK